MKMIKNNDERSQKKIDTNMSNKTTMSADIRPLHGKMATDQKRGSPRKQTGSSPIKGTARIVYTHVHVVMANRQPLTSPV